MIGQGELADFVDETLEALAQGETPVDPFYISDPDASDFFLYCRDHFDIALSQLRGGDPIEDLLDEGWDWGREQGEFDSFQACETCGAWLDVDITGEAVKEEMVALREFGVTTPRDWAVLKACVDASWSYLSEAHKLAMIFITRFYDTATRLLAMEK